MALEGYKANINVVYSTKYQVGWRPKYRRSVLLGRVAKRCKQVIRQTATKYLAEIMAFEIMPEGVPGRGAVDSPFGIRRLVQNFKGVTSRSLRQESARLNLGFPRSATNRYFLSPVGEATPGCHRTVCRKREEGLSPKADVGGSNPSRLL